MHYPTMMDPSHIAQQRSRSSIERQHPPSPWPPTQQPPDALSETPGAGGGGGL